MSYADSSRSHRELLVQLIEQNWQLVPKQFIGFAQATELVERDAVEVVLVDAQAGGEVVFDGDQPAARSGVNGVPDASFSASHV